MSADFALIVSFTIKPDARAHFMALLRNNARQSLALEPGCQRFDIVEPTQLPDQIWLYEIYSDRAAFDIHLKAPHFVSFDAETRPMVTAKAVLSGHFEENVKA